MQKLDNILLGYGSFENYVKSFEYDDSVTFKSDTLDAARELDAKFAEYHSVVDKIGDPVQMAKISKKIKMNCAAYCIEKNAPQFLNDDSQKSVNNCFENGTLPVIISAGEILKGIRSTESALKKKAKNK